jgi:hypothetical protein
VMKQMNAENVRLFARISVPVLVRLDSANQPVSLVSAQDCGRNTVPGRFSTEPVLALLLLAISSLDRLLHTARFGRHRNARLRCNTFPADDHPPFRSDSPASQTCAYKSPSTACTQTFLIPSVLHCSTCSPSTNCQLCFRNSRNCGNSRKFI